MEFTVTLEALPASAIIEAMIGEDALVPPTMKNPDWPWIGVESKTATPVFGSATAEMSATALREQPVPTLAWPVGWAKVREHPEPAPFQADSVQPRALLALVSVVPPTEMTAGAEA